MTHGTIRRATLEAIAQKMDLEDLNAITDYSGRYMYGATCVGLVTDNNTAEAGMQFILAIHEVIYDNRDLDDDDEDEFLDNASNTDFLWDLSRATCSDNMGRGMILYWPGLTLEVEEGDDNPNEPHEPARIDKVEPLAVKGYNDKENDL